MRLLDAARTCPRRHLACLFGVLTAAILMVGALLAASAIPAQAYVPYPDVPGSHPYRTAIEYLYATGVMEGFPDGTFRPDDPVTRQQFAKVIVSVLDLAVSEADVCPFPDVDVIGPGSLYPDNYVAAAFFHGITNGTGGDRFSPWRSISRAQVVTMVVRAVDAISMGYLHLTDEWYVGTWGDFDPHHQGNAQIAEYNHLLDGLPLAGEASDPWAPMTRAEIAQVLYNVDQLTRHRPPQAEWATVTNVLDANTLLIDYFGNSEVLRLIGTGELWPDHPFAAEAKAWLEGLLVDGPVATGEVLVEFDAVDRDEYGCLLGYIWLPWADGSYRYTLLNVELVERGFTYPRYLEPNIMHRDWAMEAMQRADIGQVRMWKTIGSSPLFNRWGAYGPPEAPLELRDDTTGFEVEADVSLGGWRLEDGAGHVYWFPTRSYKAGDYFTLHTAPGTDTATDLYWGATEIIWEPSADVMRLYDAQGRLVAAWFV